ncbi:MAG: hypothetical protein K9H15_16480 [Bacteroidales bacterium]|nr:hypothetical protein [Bacteroidales bacterium]
MKRAFFLTLMAFSIISINAQITGGGGGGASRSASTKQKNEKGIFDNVFYITARYSAAVGQFGNDLQWTGNEENIYGSMGIGGGWSIGNIFYLNSVELLHDLKLGVDITYLNISYIAESTNMGGTGFFCAKFGPVLSYNFYDKWILDAKLTLQPGYITWFVATSNEEYYTDGFKVRKGLGIYARKRPFTIGIDMNWGTLRDADFRYYNDSSYDDESLTANLRTGRIDLIVGLFF